MSNSGRRGIKIGHYRITPLGIGTLAALVVIIVAAILLPTLLGGNDNPAQQVAKNTAAPTESATAAPTVAATAAPTEKPAPTATPEPAPRSATIRVLGEITMELDLLKAGYNRADNSFDFAPMFAEISDIIGNADYTIADVEGTLGDTQGFMAENSKYLTPSVLATNLAQAGVDMLMLANDHAMDGGANELQSTIAKVAAAGLDYVGASATAEEKATPKVIDINGIKVGFAAYAESVRGGNHPALNLIANSNAITDIQALRDAGAEVVIAIVNWGKQYSHTPEKKQAQIAQVLVNSGADVILGYNPQAVQPAYWLDGTVNGQPHKALCLCAPGTLLSNQRKAGIDCGVIYELTLAEQEDGSITVESPTYIPTYALRYKDASGLNQYRAVAIDRYTAEGATLADGMTAADVQYMQQLKTQIQAVIGNVATAVSE